MSRKPPITRASLRPETVCRGVGHWEADPENAERRGPEHDAEHFRTSAQLVVER